MHLECNTKIRCNIHVTGYNCDYLIMNSEFEFT